MNSDAIYLDNAATSFPKPESVYDAMDSWQRQIGAAFGRGSHGVEHANSLAERCRHRIAQLTGAASDSSIAFTFSTTDGLNLLLRGILRPGQHVLTTTLEHNSILRPLQQLQERLPVTVEHLPFDPMTGRVDAAQFDAACRSNPPHLAVLNAVSNVTGIPQDLSTLIVRAKESGAIVLVDAAQHVGHLPLDVTTAGIDLLAAPGHKGLAGPLGTGFVYVNPDVQPQLVSFRCGGTGTQSESLEQPEDMPQLLESGNLNMPGIAGLDAALNWRQSDEFHELHARHQRQIPDFIDRLTRIRNVQLYCPQAAADNIGVISFSIDGLEPQQIAMILSQSFGIQCRAGFHCAPLAHRCLNTESQGGTVRLSPGLFTTDDELDQAISAVAAIAETA